MFEAPPCQKICTCSKTNQTICGQWRVFADFAQLCRKHLSKQKVCSAKATYKDRRNKSVHGLYLWRAFEMHPRNRQSGDVHCNTPVQVECPHNKKEPSSYYWPGGKKETKMNTSFSFLCNSVSNKRKRWLVNKVNCTCAWVESTVWAIVPPTPCH